MDTFELAEKIKQKAKEMLIKSEFEPIVFCLTSKNEVIVIRLEYENYDEKTKTLIAVKKIMKEENVCEYIIVTEGWCILGKKASEITDWNKMRPSQHPDKIESLIISAVTPERKKMWLIQFSWQNGIIEFSEEKIFDTADGVYANGIFMGLLEDMYLEDRVFRGQ